LGAEIAFEDLFLAEIFAMSFSSHSGILTLSLDNVKANQAVIILCWQRCSTTKTHPLARLSTKRDFPHKT
jgi:hypothetical protein